MTGEWLTCQTPRPGAARQLFCLPYAGAGPGAFRGWSAAFGPDVEVHAVQLPGRGSRFAEPVVIDPVPIAAAVAGRADRPYAIFGHSFGGRLGFEVARALRAAGAPAPLRLYPSASRPPHVVIVDGLLDGLSTAGDDELVAALTAGGGMPAEVLAEPELLELVLPAVRGDLAWLDGYDYRDAPPLATPIVAFAGSSDGMVSTELMRGWARHTSAGFAIHTVPGGHFFIDTQLPRLAATITADLLGAGRPGPRVGSTVGGLA